MRSAMLLAIILISADLVACHSSGPFIQTMGDYESEVFANGKMVCHYRFGRLTGKLEVGMMASCSKQAVVD